MQMLLSCMLILAVFPIVDVTFAMCRLPSYVSWMASIGYLVLALGVSCMLLFGRVMLKAKGKDTLLTVASLGVSVLVGAVCYLLIGRLSFGYWLVSCVAVGVVVRYTFDVDVERFSSVYVYILVSLVYVLCTCMGWLYKVETSTGVTAVLYWLFCVTFAMVVNRSRLEGLIRRRSQNLDSVPKHIFSYNSRLTLLLCCIPIPMLLLSGRVGSAVYGLLVSGARGVVYVGRLLASMFAKDSQEVETVQDPEVEYQPYYSNETSAVWDVVTVLCAVLVVYLVYRYHEDILRKVRECLQAIKGSLLHAVERTPRKAVEELPSSDGYVDYVSDVPSGYTKKSFRVDYRRYRKMPTSTECLRFGYGTLVRGLNVLHYDVRPHHTVTDVSHRFDCAEFTSVYSAILYAHATPTEHDRLLLDRLLKDVYKSL